MEGGKEDAVVEDGAQSEEEITMAEFLQEQEKLEKDANVVLGGSDPTNCTHALGYISRQALYACTTCSTKATECAGICLACSLECHDGHELVELYTKRNFRCDCGNGRLPDTKCKLCPDKSKDNPENRYNHNFRGTYCICDRPYPDPEDQVEDEMIQCIICEDWYHGRHLGKKVPDNDNYDEMICDGCMKKNEFLWFYTVQCKENVKLTKDKESSDSKPLDIEKSSPEKKETLTESPAAGSQSSAGSDVKPESSHSKQDTKPDTEAQSSSSSGASKNCETNSATNASSASSVKRESDSANTTSAPSTDTTSACVLEDLKKRDVANKSGATFWLAGWRGKLCTCSKCKDMYTAQKVEFLLDESDPVHVYEAKAPAQGGSQYDQGMEALSQLDRVHQVEALHEYNDLRTELKDYLKKFAENGKVVREEDIKEFFGQMSARKRQKTSAGMQYFCK